MSLSLRYAGQLAILTLALASCGSGAGGNGAKAPTTGGTEEGDPSRAAGLKEPEGPPGLTAEERSELTATCDPIEEKLYDALKQAKLTVEQLWYEDPKATGLDEKALAAGKELLSDPGGMSADDHRRCVELFTKNAKRELFEFEPAEKAALETLDACAKAAVNTFGSRKLSFDMSSAPAGYDPDIPRFCNDADPVPESLSELPYQSKADDWRTDEWKCLEFGLRVAQHFQLEYRTDPSATNKYECIARYLPRKGGPAVELVKYGSINDKGVLMNAKKVERNLIPRP